MEIRRTANAGIALTLDDANILLDGVCREVYPYLATPAGIVRELQPDVLLFTHNHPDHFDPVAAQKLGKPIYGPMQVAEQVSCPVHPDESLTVGSVRITAVPTRHMGHYGKTTQHQSYALEGSQKIWFLGDASPMELKRFASFSKPDVLIVPYPYISTLASVKMVETLLPCKIVLLHLPLQNADPEKIWESVAEGMDHLKAYLYLPELGETLNL